MSQILIGMVATILLFTAFAALLCVGLIKKRRKLIFLSIACFLLTAIAGVWTGFRFANKTYGAVRQMKMDNPFAARTGIQIYTAHFGAPAPNCVQVVNHGDLVVPRLDCCVWLEFTTCPAELKRIIALRPYKKPVPDSYDSTFRLPDYTPKPEWFTPSSLGDSSHVLRNHDPDNPNWDQILFFSKDSAHAFYCYMTD